jgi:hypothetical protein
MIMAVRAFGPLGLVLHFDVHHIAPAALWNGSPSILR